MMPTTRRRKKHVPKSAAKPQHKLQARFAAPVRFGAISGTNPATELSKVQTVVKNTYSKELVLSFLGVHGVTLAAGDTYTVDGDLTSSLLMGGGRRHKRYLTAIENLVAANAIQLYRNHQKIVYVAVDDATTIVKGDLLWLDTDDAKPASDVAWNTNLATTQADFAAAFLGVALSSHASGSGAVTNFPVDIGPNIYSFTSPSATYEIGDTVGPDEGDAGMVLENQEVEAAVASSSFGRVVERHTAATTSVLVRIASAFWPDSTNGELG